jgi:hypothetical protein
MVLHVPDALTHLTPHSAHTVYSYVPYASHNKQWGFLYTALKAGFCYGDLYVFPVRYEINFYALFRRN